MKLVHVHARLLDLGQPVLRTADVMALLEVKKDHASKLMARLAVAGHVTRLKRGLWLMSKELDPLALPEVLTAPFPSYVSLQSALYHHGMISQIPAITYAVSIARTRFFKTPLGHCSIHHVAPSFFFGYESAGRFGIKLASPEKTLVDFAYLGAAKTRLFRTLPELELPSTFNVKTARRMIRRIEASGRRTSVEKRFQELLGETHD